MWERERVCYRVSDGASKWGTVWLKSLTQSLSVWLGLYAWAFVWLWRLRARVNWSACLVMHVRTTLLVVWHRAEATANRCTDGPVARNRDDQVHDCATCLLAPPSNISCRDSLVWDFACCSSCVQRNFEQKQWVELQAKLHAWKVGSLTPNSDWDFNVNQYAIVTLESWLAPRRCLCSTRQISPSMYRITDLNLWN